MTQHKYLEEAYDPYGQLVTLVHGDIRAAVLSDIHGISPCLFFFHLHFQPLRNIPHKSNKGTTRPHISILMDECLFPAVKNETIIIPRKSG